MRFQTHLQLQMLELRNSGLPLARSLSYPRYLDLAQIDQRQPVVDLLQGTSSSSGPKKKRVGGWGVHPKVSFGPLQVCLVQPRTSRSGDTRGV